MLIKVDNSVPTTLPAADGMLVVLIPDNWNDWYAWKTMFSAHVVTASGNYHHLGSVKLGEAGAEGVEGKPYRPKLPPEGCSKLGETFISLGQDENYYITLKGMSDAERVEFLIAMRDCAYDNSIYARYINEDVVSTSLTRSVSTRSILGRYNRLSHGNADPTRYEFIYALPFGPDDDRNGLELEFEVVPESKPPTNVHVLIGRNSVGKTRALNLMVRALISESPKCEVGAFEYKENETFDIFGDISKESSSFAGIVSVSFSAFDRFGPHPVTKDGLAYSYVGLKKATASQGENSTADLPLKSLEELAEEFAISADACRVGRRSQAWRKALISLESDPLFEELNISGLADSVKKSRKLKDKTFFKSLSSGHGIVLLIVTRLVELVEEQTLVLIDEPETHLHPPLLSAFIRAVSNHLVDRNGVAIVATHSPVVLQEVPRSCVWKLTRSGDDLKAERPETETFGENVGTLTREVFGLEVTKSGFHNILADEVDSGQVSYDEVVDSFGGQLGAEARSILRSMIAVEHSSDGESF